jgi:uncharacterized protein (TIGR03437 family)
MQPEFSGKHLNLCTRKASIETRVTARCLQIRLLFSQFGQEKGNRKRKHMKLLKSAENRFPRLVVPRLVVLLSAFCLLAAGAQLNRITRPIDNQQRLALRGHVHPKARPENDQGRVSPGLQLPFVTLEMAQSDTQQAELDQLLAEQQTAGSPNYHHWLTPEEYGQRFGVSDSDVNQMKQWLESQGLSVAAVARGKNWIAVNGTAAQMEAAFQIEIHQYLVNGETHYANASEPSVPAALSGVVRTIRGLHDFHAKSRKHAATPKFTSTRGSHYLAPDDLAALYNISSLYNAGIDGSGQSVVIAGQTQIHLSDIQLFRTTFNLPANDPQVILVPNTQDPGISSNDLDEAHLDIEWSGAVARNAKIIYVYTFDVMQSVQYAIDQNLAPVVSTSYGSCELETPLSDVLTLRAWAKQGNAQGITWFSASGDSGGADCDDPQNPAFSVDTPASIPEVTGVGGTEFSEGSGTFWNTTNDPNKASVRSYIPETTWNDSVLDGSPSSGGGGASFFFSQPTWQVGPGVPGDNFRHVPDIAGNASADHDGYIVYTSGKMQVYGGTSVPAPAFAGLTALLNQYLVSSGAQSAPGVGNMNPTLYSLAQKSPEVFHDITQGDNIVTVACGPRVRNCTNSPVGFSAGVGYDSVTGLGSVDAYNFVTKWSGSAVAAPTPKTTITLLSNLNNVAATDVVFLVATATGPNGVTPTGSVAFQAGGVSLGSANLVGSAGTATATLSVTGTQLLQSSGTVTAVYLDSSSNSVSASVTVAVSTTGSGATGKPAIAGATNGASFKQTFAPGMILSVFGSQLATSISSASSVPLPVSMNGVAATVNGVAAPLYYISPGQLNIQIPYDVATGSAATLTVNNNGQVTSQTIQIAAVAPGIFADANGVVVPSSSAKRGAIITLFITGTGAVLPAVSTGAAPAPGTAVSNLPKPSQNTTVSVGGLPAPVPFIGIPVGLVGVTQINYQVPTNVGLGAQPVVVSVGGVNSAPVTLNITN